MYDLIGDIHDYATELKALLTKMEYREIDGTLAKAVFVDHYWMSGEPTPLSNHIACLDYSVAGSSSGKLCAYRFDGERQLSAEKFVWVNRLPGIQIANHRQYSASRQTV